MNRLGRPLILIGSTIGTIGSIVNTVFMDHSLAIYIWAVSNPLIMIWAIGGRNGYWHDGLSHRALAIMYAVFTITGIYAIWKMM